MADNAPRGDVAPHSANALHRQRGRIVVPVGVSAICPYFSRMPTRISRYFLDCRHQALRIAAALTQLRPTMILWNDSVLICA